MLSPRAPHDLISAPCRARWGGRALFCLGGGCARPPLRPCRSFAAFRCRCRSVARAPVGSGCSGERLQRLRARRCERRAFLWGATPVSLGKTKEMGWQSVSFGKTKEISQKEFAGTFVPAKGQKNCPYAFAYGQPRRCRGDPIITCTTRQVGRLSCATSLPTSSPWYREACNPRRNMASLIINVGLKGSR